MARFPFLGTPRWFTLLAGAAFLIRGFLWWQYRASPFCQVPVGDERHYWEWAGRIAAGEWRPDDVFYQGPVFPYALGALRAGLPSLDQAGLAALQLLLNWITALLVLPLFRRWVNEKTALAGSGLALFFTPAVFFSLKGMPLTLGLFLMVAGLLVLPAAGGRWQARCVLAGALGALSALTVPSTLLVLGVTAVFLLLRPPARRRVLPAAAYVAAALLVILPVTLSNYLQDRSLVLISADYGVAFLQGNNPRAQGWYTQLPGLSPWVGEEKRDTMRLARRKAGRPLNTQGVSRTLFAEGARFIADNPGRWAVLEVRKATLLLGGLDVPHEFSLARERRDFLPWLLAFPAGGTLVLALASLGLLDRGPRRRLRLPLAVAAALGCTSLLFYVANRFSCPFQFLLLPFAAGGLVSLPRLARHPWRAGAVLPVVLAAALSREALATPYWESDDYLAKLLGIYGETRNLPKVVDTLERMLAVSPHSLSTLRTVGDVYREHGEPALALAAYTQALGISAADRQTRFSRATVLVQLGRWDEAVADLTTILELDPEDEEALAARERLARRPGLAAP